MSWNLATTFRKISRLGLASIQNTSCRTVSSLCLRSGNEKSSVTLPLFVRLCKYTIEVISAKLVHDRLGLACRLWQARFHRQELASQLQCGNDKSLQKQED